jgi:hypothetical protein
MKRRQGVIPGTESDEDRAIDAEEDPVLTEAAEKARKTQSESLTLVHRAKLETTEVLAMLKAKRLPEYRYFDEDGVLRIIRLRTKESVLFEEAEEQSVEVGSGVSDGDEPAPSPDAITAALVAQAAKSQDDAGVAVDSEGDVVAPESTNGTRKRKRVSAGPASKRKANRARA